MRVSRLPSDLLRPPLRYLDCPDAIDRHPREVSVEYADLIPPAFDRLRRSLAQPLPEPDVCGLAEGLDD